MKHILIFGAGRSSFSLINYLLKECERQNWMLTVADYNYELALAKINGHEHGKAIQVDILQEQQREDLVKKADIVVSMVPARYHGEIAVTCLKLQKNLVTASYLTDEIQRMDGEVKNNGLIFLMECGLDPGIDHMSAMAVIDKIKDSGSILRSFETFTGGLLSPNPDENPWQYKFTWNPRNVVLAGQGVVKFLQEGRYKYVPYNRIFRRTEMVHIPGHGYFEGYANRDSLKYLDLYNLQGIQTLYRGTFRRPGFCRAWNVFVQIGATDDSYEMEGVDNMTHRQFINSFLPYNPHDSIELKIAHYMNLEFNSQEMFKLKWLGVFNDEFVGLKSGTPAQILEHILKKKWTLLEDDLDMIVMWHKFEFFEEEKLKVINSYMVSQGDDMNNTGMAKTVGLPLGIATKLILEGKIKKKGIRIPISKAIYEPILKELNQNGIEVKEEDAREIKMPDRNP